MEYKVYTDGSCQVKTKRAASSYFIRTRDRLINTDVMAFTGMYILEAEMRAIGMALSYINKCVDVQPGDNIIVNVDSIEAIKQCNTMNEGGRVTRSVTAVEISKMIKALKAKGASIRFKKVHAHKATMNPNKFVDSLAKSGIKHADICMR